MKRSEINAALKELEMMAKQCHFVLPPFCGFTPEEWQCNDDNTDNRFCEKAGRFPAIEEDEPPYRLLCNEYPPAE